RQGLARLAPSFDKTAAHHRIFDPAGAIEIPTVGCTARAAAWLVIGYAGAGARIIGLLRLPGDDTALDVDLPTAAARAIHTVSRAYDFVVLPALPVALLPHSVFVAELSVTVREGLTLSRKISQPF